MIVILIGTLTLKIKIATLKPDILTYHIDRVKCKR